LEACLLTNPNLEDQIPRH